MGKFEFWMLGRCVRELGFGFGSGLLTFYAHNLLFLNVYHISFAETKDLIGLGLAGIGCYT